jgi:hypothetical protein
MDSFKEKRRHKRVPYHDTHEFQRIRCGGETVDASSSGIGVLIGFPLMPGHVVEWDDEHQKGKLHIAIVKWSVQQEDRCRAGLMFI